MENSNYNELFVFDEIDRLKCPSMIKIIGVGKFGSDVVESINRAELHDIDFITINQEHDTLPSGEASQQDNVRSIARYYFEKNDSAIEEKLNEIIGEHITLVFVISSLDEDYSSIVSAICRRVHKYGNDDGSQVALALMKAPDCDVMNDKIQKGLDKVTAAATKVMTQGSVKDSSKTMCSSSDNVARSIVDVIRTVCKVFIDYDFNRVDYNDVATVLQSGTKIVYGNSIGKGNNREEEAALQLIQHIESNGYKMEDVKYMLLLLNFSPLYELTFEKLNIVTDLIHQSIGKYVDVLWNATNDVPENSDTLVLNAIAIL